MPSPHGDRQMNRKPPTRPSSTHSARLFVILVVIACVGFPLLVGQATAADPHVSITNVTASPEQPAPGQLVKLTTTIRNADSSSDVVDINDLYVRRAGGARDLTRIEDVGTVSVGSSLTIPLTHSFEEPGVKNLRVILIGETESGSYVRRQYPLTVVVREGGLRLNLDVDEPVVGTETDVAVNVSNGELASYRNLNLVVNGSNVRVEDPKRLAAVMDPGSDRTFTFTASFPKAAPSTIAANLQYMTEEGQTRSVYETTSGNYRQTAASISHPQLGVSVQSAVPGATRPVNVTVANGLDEPLRHIRVHADSPTANFTVTEWVQARMSAQNTTTFEFPARVSTAGTYPVTVTMAYTDDEGRQRVTRTVQTNFDAPPNPGRVTLTGTQAVQRNGQLEVSATASNVGSSSTEGVVVSIADAEGVGPADYFVGSVEGSDFSSFTLSTSASENLSSVPIRVRYVTDGVEQSYVTDVPVERLAGEQPTRDSGGLPVLQIGVVVLLSATIAGVYRWRR